MTNYVSSAYKTFCATFSGQQNLIRLGGEVTLEVWAPSLDQFSLELLLFWKATLFSSIPCSIANHETHIFEDLATKELWKTR